MKSLPVFAYIILMCLATLLPAQTQEPVIPSGQPSLDLLAARIDSYWNLLSQRKRLQASQYIALSDRETFEASNLPPFKEPRLKSLELSADRREVTATVTVKRMFVSLAREVEWPVTEHWRFEEGNWYCEFKRSPLPIQDTTSEVPKPSGAPQVEELKREIRELVRLEKATLDFGKVNYRDVVSLRLRCTLSGNTPMEVQFRGLPPGFLVKGLVKKALQPGQQELTVEFPASNYDGAVKERFMLIARRQGVEVPFEILIQGNVYVPVSFVPRLLQFRKGDQEKAIQVRNNSNKDVVLKSLFTETGMIGMEPLPTKIPAGQQAQIKVKVTGDLGPVNQDSRDNLVISFEQAVDGMANQSLVAVLNARAAKREESIDPAKSKEIQELIRKNQLNLPNK